MKRDHRNTLGKSQRIPAFGSAMSPSRHVFQSSRERWLTVMTLLCLLLCLLLLYLAALCIMAFFPMPP